MSRVQLQVMDEDGEFRHGLGLGETVLDEALRRAGHPLAAPPVDDASGLDLTVPADRVPEIAETVREALRAARAVVPPEDPAVDAYDRSEIRVLGETVPIRVRNPQHQALQQLNQLYEMLAATAGAGRGLVVHSIPKLDLVDRAILAVSGAEPIPRAALPGAVAAWRDEMLSLGSPADMLTALDSPAPEVLDAHVARLLRWNLISRSPDGELGTTGKRAYVRF